MPFNVARVSPLYPTHMRAHDWAARMRYFTALTAGGDVVIQEAAPSAVNLLPVIMPLIGVLIGGGITFGYQSYFRRQDRKRARKERLRRIHHTTADLANSIFDLYVGAHEHLPNGHKIAPDDLWHQLPPMHGFDSEPIRYSVDDTAIMSGPKFDGIASQLRLLATRRNAVVSCIPIYNNLRREIGLATVPFQSIRDGDRIATDAKYREVAAIRLLELQTNSMAKQILAALLDLKDEILALIPRYNELLKELDGPKTTARIELEGKGIEASKT